MGDENVRALSFLTPEQMAELGGLPPEAVVGTFAGDAVDERLFRANRVFIEFMHDVIRTRAPEDPALLSAAAAQGDGWVYVIDQRTPDGPQGRVPSEDVIGGFKVEGGRVVDGSYWANADHRVFTRHGMVRLTPSLQEALVQELYRRSRAAGGRPGRG